jgi:hypothetical protein
VCAAGQAAGWHFVQDETSVGKVASKIALGKQIPSGAFKGNFFGVPAMSDFEQSAASDHLYVEDGVPGYSPKPRLQKFAPAGTDSDLEVQSTIGECSLGNSAIFLFGFLRSWERCSRY